jgi:hypothetical protein
VFNTFILSRTAGSRFLSVSIGLQPYALLGSDGETPDKKPACHPSSHPEHEERREVHFLLYPHDKWIDPDGRPYLTLPTKKSVQEPLASFLLGTSVEAFVEGILREDLELKDEDYVLEQELEPAQVELTSPAQHEFTRYTIYPVYVWVHPSQRDPLCEGMKGQWLSCEEAAKHPRISPTASKVFERLRESPAEFQAELERIRQSYAQAKAAGLEGEAKLDKLAREYAAVKSRAEALRRLFDTTLPDRPSMDGLALKWFSQNRSGVRHLPRKTLDEILDAGNRAFNLRVADPYLRYQTQGLGFTWSFFTQKDAQDVHVHGAPVVEIYGILEGQMEIWSKPYYDRGTSAWSHRILEPGDWVEVDSLQCHIVHWLGQGKGVVFKAGPGPLAEVGKLGVKGKTPCDGCPCMKPLEVLRLEKLLRRP